MDTTALLRAVANRGINKQHANVELIFDIKEKLTDNEYKTLVEAIAKTRDTFTLISRLCQDLKTAAIRREATIQGLKSIIQGLKTTAIHRETTTERVLYGNPARWNSRKRPRT